MNIAKKLETFAGITEKEAGRRRMEILKKIDGQINSAVEESRATALKKAEEKEKQALNKADEEFVKEISLFEGKMKRKIMLSRSELVKEVFHLAEEKLVKYTLSNEYFEKLKMSVKTKLEKGGVYKIELSLRDYNRLCEEYPQYGDIMSVSGEDIIGGYKIFLSGGKKAVDYTYKTALEESEYDFGF